MEDNIMENKYDFSGISTETLRLLVAEKGIREGCYLSLNISCSICPLDFDFDCGTEDRMERYIIFKKELERRESMENQEFEVGETIEVRDCGDEYWNKRTFLTMTPSELSNGYKYIVINSQGSSNPVGYKYARKVETKVELTMKEIADRFDIDLSDLRIKDE